MSRKPNYFDRLFIQNPCPTDWDQMTGNDQVRHCSECNKKVYNLSKMTRDQAEALVARFEGRLCARFERRADGVIWTDENSSNAQLISRRASPVASAIVTAILSLSGSAVALTSSQSSAPVPIHSQSRANKNAEQPQVSGVGATISGTLLDPQGAVIVGGSLTLKNESTGEERTKTSSDEGAFSFTSLQEGSYALKAEANGFIMFQAISLSLKSNNNMRFDITMQIATTETVVVGGAVATPTLPLHQLYDKSERIVIARIGKSVPVKKEDENSLMKTALNVSRNIKGHGKKTTIYVYHWGWGEDKKFPGGYQAGDNLLLFLTHRKEGGYEPLDAEYGVKKLSEADLDIYAQRIKELAAILDQAKPNAKDIVEWLVRCVEAPATRWEGAYELAGSVQQELPEDNAEPDEAESADGPDMPAVVSNKQAGEASSTCNKADSDSNFAAMLTDQQKERLMAILLNIETLTEKDMPLVDLAKSWKDERLVSYILSQLRSIEANPPRITEYMMTVIADVLKDEDINLLVSEYRDTVSYEDLDQEESDDAEVKDAEADNAETDAEKVDAAGAKQRRSVMVRSFLATVEKKMANR